MRFPLLPAIALTLPAYGYSNAASIADLVHDSEQIVVAKVEFVASKSDWFLCDAMFPPNGDSNF